MRKKRTIRPAGHVAAKPKAATPSQPSDLEYLNLFNGCVIQTEKTGAIDQLIDNKLLPNRSRYQDISNQVGSGPTLRLPAFYQPGNQPALTTGTFASSAGNLLFNDQGLARQPATDTGTFLQAPNLGKALGNGLMNPAVQFGFPNGSNEPGTGAIQLNPFNSFQQGAFGLKVQPLSTYGFGKIPWYFIACAHLLECSLDFTKHLHNGDPLTGYTKRVPPNRPQVGHPPPFTFEESAVDAMKLMKFDKINSWILPVILRKLEAYNGFGYFKYHQINTPYLWSGSNNYTKGKYVADNKYDSEAVSTQIGAAVILKRMEQRSLIYIPRN